MMCDRVIVLIDMDCFYCQVEELLDPNLKGKPIAVVQYNAWKGGGIIAVNYTARARGVTRHMRGEEAQRICPDIVLARVPNKQNKADTSKYRDAGKRVAAVLQTFTPLLERASVDEAYMDITDNINKWLLLKNERVTKELLHDTYAVGHSDIIQFFENVYPEDDSLADENVLKLAVGGCIANSIRSAVFQGTGYECSAGIAHNKVLAKLVCGMNKPNKQTIMPHPNLEILYSTLPVTKLRSLGGKFGEHVCESLKIKFMFELSTFSEKQLQHKFNDKYGSWLYNIARGFDNEPVVQRLTSKSIGCCKKFPGRSAITSVDSLKHWLHQLAEEIVDRLQKDEIENSRKAKQLVVSFALQINKQDVSNSRSTRLNYNEAGQIADQSFDIICQNYPTLIDKESPDLITLPVKFLGLNVGKFENNKNKLKGITSFFNKVGQSDNKTCEKNLNSICDGSSTLKIKNGKAEVEEKITGRSSSQCNLNLQKWDAFEAVCGNESKIQNRDNLNYSNDDDIVLSTNEISTIINNFSEEFRENNCDASPHKFIESNVMNRKEVSESSIDISASSFFLKYHQENNDCNTNVDNNLTIQDSGTPVQKIYSNLSISIINNFVHSDDSYSSTTELESILQPEIDKSLRNMSSNDNESNETEDLLQTNAEQDNLYMGNSSNNIDSDFQFALELSKNEQANETNLQKCNECGKEVPDLLTHMDHHLALRISLQQREEFRQNEKLNYSPKKNGHFGSCIKKRKQSKKISKDNIKKSKTIIAFFKSQ